MPSDIQVYRKVPLNNADILGETKLALHKLLKTFDSIISKSNKDIGQIDLIEMYIATRLDSAPVAAQPYPLTLKHHDFLEQEIKNLLDTGIIHKSMSLWASPIIAVKNTPPRAPHSNSDCALITES